MNDQEVIVLLVDLSMHSPEVARAMLVFLVRLEVQRWIDARCTPRQHGV